MTKSQILHQMHLDHVPTSHEVVVALLTTAIVIFYLYILLIISYGPVLWDVFRSVVQEAYQMSGYA
jgi:hypothetical protein